MSNKTEQQIFMDGYIEGLKAFAWWRDSVQYVGTCGTTLAQAIADADTACRFWNGGSTTAGMYPYNLIGSRPLSEGGPLEFMSYVPDLDQRPELWEKECPYDIGTGEIVKL